MLRTYSKVNMGFLAAGAAGCLVKYSTSACVEKTDSRSDGAGRSLRLLQ